MRRRHLGFTATVFFTLLGPGSLLGQAGDIRVEVGASRSFPPAGVDAAASTYVTAALRTDWTSKYVGLFAGAFGGKAMDNWGGDFIAGMAGARLSTPESGPVSASLLAAGSGFRVNAPFIYETFTGLLQPEVRLRLGRTVLALVGEGGLGTTDITANLGDMHRSATIDLWHYGGGGEIRVAGTRALFTIGVATYEAKSGRYTKGEVQLAVVLPSGAQIHGGLGLWDLPVGPETIGEITVTVPVGNWFAQASGGRSAPDPLLRTAPGSQGWMTVGRVLKRFGPGPRVPLLTLEPVDEGAIAHFRIEGGTAEKVELIGDFTGWEPIAMSHADGTRWTVTLEIPRGTHHFGFLVDGEWFVPESAPGRVADDWGQVNATMVVQ